MTQPNQTKGQSIAEFSETQAALAKAWRDLNALAVAAERKERVATQEAQTARRVANKAYQALHEHVFGANFDMDNEVKGG